MTRTLYFSYSTPDLNILDLPEPLSSPYTITWHLGRFLRERAAERGYAFQYVNLDDTTPRRFDDSDVVIGHTWHAPDSFMRQALAQQACPTFVLQPYSHGMVSAADASDYAALFGRATHCFWITGRRWFETMADSPFAGLANTSTRVDMAVNPALHPYRKERWNPPGKRGWLAVGADIPAKGLDRVAELAQVAGLRLGYFGDAPLERFQHVAQFHHYGGVEFTPDMITAICKDYDFFLTLGRMDANPTTLLETAAWGLVGLCNPNSGYWPDAPFIGLDDQDLCANWEIVERWQNLSEYDLREHSERLRRLVEREYTWERFTQTVWCGIEASL